MPELPEVETVRRITEPQIIDRTVSEITINAPSVIAHPLPEQFCAGVVGNTFSGVGRRGKFLIFYFEDGGRMILHLRMTGQLLVTPPDHPIEKHTHLIMKLSGGGELRYIDVRRFGRFWYFAKDEDYTITGLGKLGVEPDDDALTARYLKDMLGNKNKPVKEMLHDQSVIAGIGNIYSDEILFECGIHPAKRCRELTDEEYRTLAEKIPAVISYYIEKNETTPEEYLTGGGKDYRNTPYLKVYARAGKPCAKCSVVLCRTTVGGRSSVFCPACQKKEQT